MSEKRSGKIGILVGGGPAPGINAVIGSATIEANRSGMDVVGIYDGFKWLSKGDKEHVRSLITNDVSRIHFEGGSILRTSRTNPTKKIEDLQMVLSTIKELGITHLITIGGDDTALSASELSRVSEGSLKVAHVPKTIDNDIPLPGNLPTFGFQTARHVGTEIVKNLMEDARSTNRWYFVVVMGRKAGHLAVGIAKSAGAHVAIIGEEFTDPPIGLEEVSRILEGTVIKRRAMGHDHGVAVIAEGIGEILSLEELKAIPDVVIEYDEHHHMRLSEVPLATIFKRIVRRIFADRGENPTLVDVSLGYELRCTPPIPFDIEYCRDLGYAAIKFLLEEADNTPENSGGLICILDGESYAIPFKKLREQEEKKIKVRLLDVQSRAYEVAYEYMLRLKGEDFTPENLPLMAKAANMSEEEFKDRFGRLVNPISGKKLIKEAALLMK